MMIYCRNCGTPLPDTAAFCRVCGSRLPRPAADSQQTGAPEQSTVTQQHPYIPYTQRPNAGRHPQTGTAHPSAHPQTGNRGVYPYPNTIPTAPAAAKTPTKKRRLWLTILIGLLVVVAICVVVAVIVKSAEPTVPVQPLPTPVDPPVTDPAPTPGQPTEEYDGIVGTDITDVPFRDYHVTPLGEGKDSVTIMVYMVGSDLETRARAASRDLDEMMRAQTDDSVNVVIQTGGCRRWDNESIGDGKVQRWLLEDGELKELQDLGRTQMLTSDALADFIRFSAQNYPASRYGIIFWDHGGGALYGFGYDELYPDDVLFLPDIEQAMEASGVMFDFVGFDACLMATVEIAYMLEPYADYLIASQETEFSEGWEYAGWLTNLSEDPSAKTVEIGRWIVDEYVKENGETETLSVVSLREIPYVYDCLGEFFEEAHEALRDRRYNYLSTLRADTKYFATSDYDLIDIVDFAVETAFASSDELIEAVDSAVKYRSDSTVSGIYGLSMYFPYVDVSVYDYAKMLCAEVGFSGDTYRFFDSFVSVLATGQYELGGQEGPSGGEDQADNPDSFSWYDEEAVENEEYSGALESLQAVWSDSLNEYIIPLTEEQWEEITGIELTIFYDDGEGYIDLGSDQVFMDDEQGNLILNFDNTWVAIDGMIVPYYAERIDETSSGIIFSGYVPATLNGEDDIQLILQWKDEADNGYIAGYRFLQDGGTLGKGLLQLKEGDSFEVYCDYYLYDGTPDGEYYLGDKIVVGSSMPKVTYEDIGDAPVQVGYRIVDIYQNEFYTEFIKLEME